MVAGGGAAGSDQAIVAGAQVGSEIRLTVSMILQRAPAAAGGLLETGYPLRSRRYNM